jgi:hypothetical protein
MGSEFKNVGTECYLVDGYQVENQKDEITTFILQTQEKHIIWSFRPVQAAAMKHVGGIYHVFIYVDLVTHSMNRLFSSAQVSTTHGTRFWKYTWDLSKR